MRLQGEVVLKACDEWTDAKTGLPRQSWKVYFKASDPRDGATEISVPEDVYNQIPENQEVSFEIAFGVRTFAGVSRAYVRYIGNLEVIKAKKA